MAEKVNKVEIKIVLEWDKEDQEWKGITLILDTEGEEIKENESWGWQYAEDSFTMCGEFVHHYLNEQHPNLAGPYSPMAVKRVEQENE